MGYIVANAGSGWLVGGGLRPIVNTFVTRQVCSAAEAVGINRTGDRGILLFVCVDNKICKVWVMVKEEVTRGR